MRTYGLRLALALVLVLSVRQALAAEPPHLTPASTVSRTFEIGALRMTYEDLDILLAGTGQLVQTANGDEPREGSRGISVTVSADEDALTIKDWAGIAKLRPPSKANRAMVIYDAESEASISRIEIFLNDTFRRVDVQGANATQVQAVAEYLRRGFNEHQTMFGGLQYRLICMILLVVVLMLGAFTLSRRFPRHHLIGEVNGHRFAPPVVTIFVVLVAVPFPWDEWMSGMAIFTGDAGFLSRNATLFTALSLVLTVIALPFFWRARRTSAPSDADTAVDAGKGGPA